MTWRRDLEMQVLDTGRGIVLRPAFVYGRGGGEILRTQIKAAMNRRRSLYPGDGGRCWPNVHVDDLGRAYALSAERAAPGTLLNIAGGEATLRSVSEAVGRLIGEPGATSSVPRAEAIGVLPYAGWLGATGTRIDSTRARRILGWKPTGPDIHWEIEFGSYRALRRETQSDPPEGEG
jgi:nucleoside-diphosphate-sugar epimerase